MDDKRQEQAFDDTPEGWASRIKYELDAARKAVKDWHEQAERTLKEYLDDREGNRSEGQRWNIFTADTQTKQAMLFGNPPRASVSRRYADADDDVARVACEMMERLLNADIEGQDDTFSEAVSYAHDDRELTGLGLCRIRYEPGETVKEPGQPAMLAPDGVTELAPAVPEVERRPNEVVETDWVHWKDVYWSPCRVWHEVTKLFFGADMSHEQLVRKFGKEVADALPTATRKPDEQREEKKWKAPYERARVWEVWCKYERQVFFFVEGYERVLAPVGVQVAANGGVPDPLGLEGFWPCPRPMLANVTTSKLVPKPDRELAKDLYDEVNTLSTRITLLERAVRVIGVYDKTNTALKRLLTETSQNEMVPVENWAMFGEKGGLRGAVDWFPLEAVVNALTVLRDQRTEHIEALRQLTGMADIMRGHSTEQRTATETRAITRFGSVRLERRQKELARFASDLQRLRAEVMAKHFDPATLLARSNMEKTPDAALAQQAIEMWQGDGVEWRIEVKPEAMSMTDFDALKAERSELLAAISEFLGRAQPLMAQAPATTPFLLRILKWVVAGVRGSSEIEGVLDEAIAAAEKAPPTPAQPDPKLQQLQAKGEQDREKVQAELQADLVRTSAEADAEDAKQQSQMKWNLTERRLGNLIDQATKPPAPPGGPRR